MYLSRRSALRCVLAFVIAQSIRTMIGGSFGAAAASGQRHETNVPQRPYTHRRWLTRPTQLARSMAVAEIKTLIRLQLLQLPRRWRVLTIHRCLQHFACCVCADGCRLFLRCPGDAKALAIYFRHFAELCISLLHEYFLNLIALTHK
jgi:hypothetical protein